MEPNSLKWVGSPCGLHGPYIFYKAFRFHLEGKPRILSLGDFFFVRCKPEDPICIAELQLLWEERTTKQLLSSSKLYFLPEDTPQGRTVSHGEDELIAVSEKVIVKLEDLVKWTVSDFSQWKCGLRAVPLKPAALRDLGKNGQREALQKYRESTLNSGLNFKDVLKEKAELGDDGEERKVLVLSYPQYCRYRSVIARLRERPSSLLTDHVVLALGGIAALSNNTQILYCRDTFDHPTLIENESICDEFAPNLKGRPRKKKPSISQRRDSQGQSSAKEASSSEGKAPAKVKADSKAVVTKPKSSGSCKKASAEEKPKVGAGEECPADEQAFLVALYKYMKERKTPIERIPYLGFKQINLWTMFQAAQKLGGYELITARRQWKNVYDELGGNPGSTSAATCTRRHYERLILPYERYTKGEEDKPLPPLKPRKQEAGSQEGGSKTKVTAVKRPKEEQNQKPKNEKDAAVKGLELSPVSDEKDMSGEAVEPKQEAQPAQQLLPKEERKSGGEEEEEELQLTVKEEALGAGAQEKALHRGLPWENGQSERVAGDTRLQPPPEPPELLDNLATKLQEEAANGFPVSAPKPLRHCHAQDQRRDCKVEHGVPCATGMAEPPSLKDPQNQVGMVLPTLKQKPPPALSAREVLPEKEEAIGKEESCFSYAPVLYPRGNPGIMSPLAKKKLLSQVSGTALPNNYSFGPPPPLINKKSTSSGAEELAGLQGPQASAADTMVVNRPSVIQHAQSFKPRSAEERKTLNDVCVKPEHFGCDLPQPQPSPAGDAYMLRADPHDTMEKAVEKKLCPSQPPSFLCDFYSSPHLHSLYRQTEHHLGKEQLTKYLGREVPFSRDCDSVQGFPPGKHPENHVLSYGTHLSQKDKMPPGERSLDDQPTDLSLPKSSPHKLPCSKPSLCGLPHSMLQQDVNATHLFQAGNNQTSSMDYHPRACRVPPMTMTNPKKAMDPLPRVGGKAQNGRGEDIMGYKVEEMSRPILSAKSSPQNICATRPLKRNLEELESGPPEKKVRVVTPMHSAKDAAGRARTPDAEGEGMKPAEPAHAVHINSYAEGHKFPLHSPIFPGLYPGAFVSQVQDVCDSLGSHLPAGYTHPLQYLKNQAVISPLMPPFAIHSFMMQRQLLASTAGPPHLYRHPAGASYGDLLHHGLYPMSALNPQPAFSPSQLPSVHPSTKLS
ncbi:AT-rich interactive domain-containing protein 5B isoform X1 [Megalops cyprinoides]|uniref:AT-rich interactive domain-containing protein 5B isoform X1 n=1 Tax=Megalops cyprinoides TaxID=118141 RepID=UPI0018655BDD|nr:AT-rich interactive domain-containing protein 5B isoform X1 [Megalops cyprinoides]